MPLRIGDALPDLSLEPNWINGAPQIGKGPLLVHFWAVSCYMCKQNMPEIRQFANEFGPKGLQLVAVHMPRQPEDTDQAKVEEAIAQFSITEPCAIDNAHLLKDAFQNDQGWVPAYFLFDAQGKLKTRAAGEAGIGIIKGALARLFNV